jgi:hypothetical protein
MRLDWFSAPMGFHQCESSRIGEVTDLDVGKPGSVRRHTMEIVPIAVIKRDPIHLAAGEGAAMDVPIHRGHVDVFAVGVEHVVIVQFREILEIDPDQPAFHRPEVESQEDRAR